MYRCSFCRDCVGPNIGLLRHVVSRTVKDPRAKKGTRTEIAKEIPVCKGCKSLLDSGKFPKPTQAISQPAPAPQTQALKPVSVL